MGLQKLLTQTKGTLLQQKYLFNVSLISLSHALSPWKLYHMTNRGKGKLYDVMTTFFNYLFFPRQVAVNGYRQVCYIVLRSSGMNL